MSVLLDVAFPLMCSTAQSLPEDVGEAETSLAVEWAEDRFAMAQAGLGGLALVSRIQEGVEAQW